MTKKERGFYERWWQSKCNSLNQIYHHYSDAKAMAFEWCMEDCARVNGFRFRIIGHNSNVFSVGYAYESNGKTFLRVQTPYKQYDFVISHGA